MIPLSQPLLYVEEPMKPGVVGVGKGHIKLLIIYSQNSGSKPRASNMHNNDNDGLQLAKESRLTSQLDKKEVIVFSAEAEKFTDVNKVQSRIIMVTSHAVYCIHRTQNFIKAMMSRLVNFDKKYVVKRKILLQNVEALTLSTNEGNSEMVIHAAKDYDERIRILELSAKKTFLKVICQQFQRVTKRKMKFFFKNEVTLEHYCTQKCDLKAKVSRMPKQNPVYLNVQDLTDYEPQGAKFEPLYSFNGQAVDISKFISSSLEKMKEKREYFSIQSKNIEFESLKDNLENRHQFVNLPHYIYKATENLYILRPIMIGGKMDKLVSTLGALKLENCIFYIAQLIVALEFLHARGWVYRAMSLSNIYIKENGYICIDGLNKLMKKRPSEGETLYDICGLPEDLAPEMILCLGYGEGVDVWGLGLCAYHMLEAHHPFASCSVKETFKNVFEKKLEAESVPGFVLKCLQRDPGLRPTLAEIKQDPCFEGIDWKALEREEIISPYIPEINSTSEWEGKLPSIVYLEKPAD